MKRLALVAGALVALAGCASGSSLSAPLPTPSSPLAGSSGGSLTVFAAASLRAAFEEAATAYRAASGVDLTLSLDASSALRTQIEQGAPADVFASADTRNAQLLVDAGLTDGALAPFAGNELTLIVPAGNPAGIETPADMAGDDVRIIAAGDEVPITQYAVQAVAALGELDGYPTHFAASYEANVVSREDNVAAVRTKIELGEGDAAIVYVTDAIASGDFVEQVELPAQANIRATYAAVVVSASEQPMVARAFLDWLMGPGGQDILGNYGFTSTP